MNTGSASAVDQDVEATQLGDRFLGDRLGAFQRARVTRDEERVFWRLGVCAAGRDDDGSATVDETLRDSSANPARAARDERAFVGKFLG